MQKDIADLIVQIRRQIALSAAILERFARSYEELDGLRLGLEELRELLSDYFAESGRNADRIAERLERLERLAILEKVQTKETLEIKSEITDDLYRATLRHELIQQTKNLAYTREKAAKYGLDIPVKIQNELALFEERIEAIQKELGS